MLMPDEIPTIVRGSRASIPPHMASDGGALSQAQIMMERLMRREDPHPALKLLTEPPPDEQITLPERVTPGQGDSSSGKDTSSQKSGASSEGPDKRAPKDRVSPAIRHTRFGRQPTTPPRSGRAVGTHFPRRTLSMTPVVGGRYRRDSEHRAPSSPLSIPYPETRPIRPPSPGNSSSTNTSDVPDATEEVPSSSRSTKSPRSSIDSPALSPAIESPVDRTPPRPDNRPPAPLVRAFPTNTQQPRRASSNDVTASPATGVQRGGGSQYLYAGRPTPAAASPDGAPERHPPPRSPSGDLDKMQGRAAWSPERRLTSPHGARRAASASGAPAPASASASGHFRLPGHTPSGVFLASPAGRVSLNAVSAGPNPRGTLAAKAAFPTNATPIAATTNALRGPNSMPGRTSSPFSRPANPNAPGGILRGPTGANRPPEPTMIISPSIAQYSSMHGAPGYA